MLYVKITILRYIDDHQPGWVECKLADYQGRDCLFNEKVPIVTAADLDWHSVYPQPGVIACQILKRWFDRDGREVVTIDTSVPWRIESVSGETCFHVWPDQLVDE